MHHYLSATTGALACDLHLHKSRTRHFEALIAQNRELEQWIGEEAFHFVQHVHQLLVTAFGSQSVCIASSCPDLINPDVPGHEFMKT